MDFKFLLEILITVGGWCIMIGMYVSKIKQHDEKIMELEKKSDETTKLLNSINTQLTEISTMVELLVNGRLKTGAENK